MIYSENRDAFRASLVKTSAAYFKVSEDTPPTAGDMTSAHAHRGNVMAGTYAYTLAAAIKLVEEAHGPDAADEIASRIEDILVNGDDADTNADVSAGVAP